MDSTNISSSGARPSASASGRGGRSYKVSTDVAGDDSTLQTSSATSLQSPRKLGDPLASSSMDIGGGGSGGGGERGHMSSNGSLQQSPLSKLNPINGGFDGAVTQANNSGSGGAGKSPDKKPSSPSQQLQLQPVSLSPTSKGALNPISDKRSPPHSMTSHAESFNASQNNSSSGSGSSNNNNRNNNETRGSPPIKSTSPRALNELSGASVSGRINRYKPLGPSKSNDSDNTVQREEFAVANSDLDASPNNSHNDNHYSDSINNSDSSNMGDRNIQSNVADPLIVDTKTVNVAALMEEESSPNPAVVVSAEVETSSSYYNDEDSSKAAAPIRPMPPARAHVGGGDDGSGDGVQVSPRTAHIHLTKATPSSITNDINSNADSNNLIQSSNKDRAKSKVSGSLERVERQVSGDDYYDEEFENDPNNDSNNIIDNNNIKNDKHNNNHDNKHNDTGRYEDLDIMLPSKIDEFDFVKAASRNTSNLFPSSSIDPAGAKEYDMTAGEIAMFSSKPSVDKATKTAFQSLQSTCRLSLSHEMETLDDPLHRAIAENSEIAVRMMLDGYEINASHAICSRDVLGRNAAHILCLSQNVEILNLVMLTYRQFVYSQLVQQLGEMEVEKQRLLKSNTDNLYKAKYQKSVINEWYEKQKYNFHRHAEFRIECWWLKIMSTRDSNGKTPINYAVSSNAPSAFLRKLFTVGRGNINTKEDNVFKYKSISYNLPHLFREGSLYDVNSGRETANCRETLFDEPSILQADAKNVSTTRSISFEVSSNPTMSINPRVDTEFQKSSSAPNWDILLPWLYRNILKRAKDSSFYSSSSSQSRDSKDTEPKSPQDIVLQLLRDYDSTPNGGGGFVLLQEFRTFLSKLGICVTSEVLKEVCLRYPGDVDLTRAKWQKCKSQFKEELTMTQQNRRSGRGSGSGSKGGGDDDEKTSLRESKGSFSSSDSKHVSSKNDKPGGPGAKAESKTAAAVTSSSSSSTSMLSDFKLAKEHNDIPSRFKDEEKDNNELYISDPYLEEDKEISLDINTFVRVLKSESSLKGLEINAGSHFERLSDISTTTPSPTLSSKVTAAGAVDDNRYERDSSVVVINTNSSSSDLPSIVSVQIIKEIRKSLVNIPDIEGWTPLVIASKNDNESLIVDLIHMGGDITKLGPDQFSALSVAKTLPVKNALDKALVGKLTTNFGDTLMTARSSYNNKEKSMLFDAFVPQILSLKDKNWAYSKGPVAYAALNGLRSSVTQLMASGLDVNAPDLAGRTALHECSVFVKNARSSDDISRACDIIDDLIAGGASTVATSVSRRNPLHELFCRNQDDVPTSFKVNDKVFMTKSSDYSSLMGNTADMSAKRRLYIAKLLDLGVSATQLDRSGFSPLHYCAKEGSVQDMLTLLLQGCDPRLKSKTGYTALHVACANGNYDIASLLTRWDGDSSMKNSIAQMKGGDMKFAGQLFPRKPPQFCIDSLWSACRSGNLAKVNGLIASLNSQSPVFGNDVRFDRSSWLYSKIDAKTRLYKITALHATILGCGELLLNKGSSTLIRSSSSSFSISSSSKVTIPVVPIYKVFHYKIPKPDEKSRLGNAQNCGEIIDAFSSILTNLISSGAFIDSFDINMRTPLMYAAALGIGPLVETLIGYGANMNLVDTDNNSALHLAYLYGATSTVHILERSKCDQNLNRNGDFPVVDIMGEFEAFPSIVTPLHKENDISLK